MGYPTVLVLDGNTRASLAVVRSLGRAGCKVVTGAERHPSLASSSCFSFAWFTYPDPYMESAAFIEKVLGAVKTARADILMPVAELSTLLILENRKRFEPHCALPFPDFKAAACAADKGRVLAIAESLGIPVPASRLLQEHPGAEGMEVLLASAAYPVVVKPCRSCVPSGSGWRKTRVRYAGNSSGLNAVLESAAGQGEYPLLIQEKIAGEGVGVFLFLVDGDPVAAFSHRRLREKPPTGGVSVLRESIALDPQLLDDSVRLLRALGWRGVAMVEFKMDRSSGKFKLMEINGRFWGSLQLAINAGVDFPALLARRAMGMATLPVTKYRVGCRLRWLWGDMDSLISLLRAHSPGRAADTVPIKVRAVRDFLQFRDRDLRYEVFDREDIQPWLHETKEWLLGRT